MKRLLLAAVVCLFSISAGISADLRSSGEPNADWVKVDRSASGRAANRLLGNEEPTEVPAACCKVCTKGKPCGDTCIAQDKTCHVGPGCAC